MELHGTPSYFLFPSLLSLFLFFFLSSSLLLFPPFFSFLQVIFPSSPKSFTFSLSFKFLHRLPTSNNLWSLSPQHPSLFSVALNRFYLFFIFFNVPLSFLLPFSFPLLLLLYLYTSFYPETIVAMAYLLALPPPPCTIPCLPCPLPFVLLFRPLVPFQ